MKFGKELEKVKAGHEWSVYYVDYKQMKKTIKAGQRNIWEAERRSSAAARGMSDLGIGEVRVMSVRAGSLDGQALGSLAAGCTPVHIIRQQEVKRFFQRLEHEKDKVARFYARKDSWARSQLEALSRKLSEFGAIVHKCSQARIEAEVMEEAKRVSCLSFSLSLSLSTCAVDPRGVFTFRKMFLYSQVERIQAPEDALSNSGLELNTIGDRALFADYLSIKKELQDFEAELHLVMQYIYFNREAFRKIVKKMDKKFGTKHLPSFVKSMASKPATQVGQNLPYPCIDSLISF